MFLNGQVLLQLIIKNVEHSVYTSLFAKWQQQQIKAKTNQT